jgi:fructoselysine-6-P-deglycase FrlB-like protein
MEEMDLDLLTRVVRLEAKTEMLERIHSETRQEMRDGMAELRHDVKAILEKLQNLDKEQARMALIISLTAAGGSATLVEIARHFIK